MNLFVKIFEILNAKRHHDKAFWGADWPVATPFPLLAETPSGA